MTEAPVPPETVRAPSRRTIIIIAVVAVVVVAAAAIGIGLFLAARGTGDAQTAYDTARERYDTVRVQLSAQIEEADLVLASTPPEQLADPALFDPLRTARDEAAGLEEIDPLDEAQRDDTAALQAATTELESATGDAQEALDTLTAAREDVVTSADEFAVAAARTVLQSSVTAAEKTYDAAEGRVDDESLRTELGARLDASRALLDADDATVEDLASSATALDEQRALVEEASTPQFADIDGEWCLWSSPSQCMTIALPNADSEYGRSLISPPHAGDAATCWIGSIGPPDNIGGAMLIYCPAGSVAADFTAEFENAAFDRIYMTQQMYIDPWFRKDELAAATGG